MGFALCVVVLITFTKDGSPYSRPGTGTTGAGITATACAGIPGAGGV
jgi:hypothetical protein